MAKFGPWALYTLADFGRAFRNLRAGLYSLSRENIQDGEIINPKAGFTFLDYIPQITTKPGSTMSVSAVASARGSYCLLGNLLLLNIKAVFTTAGVADYWIRASLPPALKKIPRYSSCFLPANTNDGGWDSGWVSNADATSILILKNPLAVWGIGASKEIIVNGILEMVDSGE